MLGARPIYAKRMNQNTGNSNKWLQKLPKTAAGRQQRVIELSDSETSSTDVEATNEWIEIAKRRRLARVKESGQETRERDAMHKAEKESVAVEFYEKKKARLRAESLRALSRDTGADAAAGAPVSSGSQPRLGGGHFQ